MRTIIALLAGSLLFASAASAQSRRPPVLGVVGQLDDGTLCLVVSPAMQLHSDMILSARQMPTDGVFSGIEATLVVGDTNPGCAGLVGGDGSADYEVTVLYSSAELTGAFPLVVPLDPQWSIATTSTGWELRASGTDVALTPRSCTSAEGLHLTLWEGPPLSSRKAWHMYFFLGYDVEASCVPADYEDRP